LFQNKANRPVASSRGHLKKEENNEIDKGQKGVFTGSTTFGGNDHLNPLEGNGRGHAVRKKREKV